VFGTIIEWTTHRLNPPNIDFMFQKQNWVSNNTVEWQFQSQTSISHREFAYDFRFRIVCNSAENFFLKIPIPIASQIQVQWSRRTGLFEKPLCEFLLNQKRTWLKLSSHNFHKINCDTVRKRQDRVRSNKTFSVADSTLSLRESLFATRDDA
jgi:hypothetical protein